MHDSPYHVVADVVSVCGHGGSQPNMPLENVLHKHRPHKPGVVAQLVEQRTFNPLVVGSSPTNLIFASPDFAPAYNSWLGASFLGPGPFVQS